jgi:hypothetical protein
MNIETHEHAQIIIDGERKLREKAEAEVKRLRRQIAEMAGIASLARHHINKLIELELAEAGREAIAAYDEQ